MFGHRECLHQLLGARADVGHKSHDGVTALMCACRIGHARIIRMLLQMRADPNDERNSGEIWSVPALRAGRVRDNGCTKAADTCFQHQWAKVGTALMVASTLGHAEAAQELIDAGANPRDKSPNGMSALTCALRAGHA